MRVPSGLGVAEPRLTPVGLSCCLLLSFCSNSVAAVETMLSNFILPLQRMPDASGRIHCSLNLNTETGRLVPILGWL